MEDVKQLVRCSGSVGANYIEANESLSKKDFIYRVKICRKEAKESGYWLELLHLYSDEELEVIRKNLLKEASEFVKIFSAIIQNRSK
jgi:four helix bundle protein